jgi:hypothetical protein
MRSRRIQFTCRLLSLCWHSFDMCTIPFVTDDSFIACSIEGIAEGGVVVWLFLSIEPTLWPSFVVATRSSAVDDMSDERYCSTHENNQPCDFYIAVSLYVCAFSVDLLLRCRLSLTCIVTISLTDAVFRRVAWRPLLRTAATSRQWHSYPARCRRRSCGFVSCIYLLLIRMRRVLDASIRLPLRPLAQFQYRLLTQWSGDDHDDTTISPVASYLQ